MRSWFRQRDKEHNRRHGREILDREFARLNVRNLGADELARQLRLADGDALCTALGAGDLTSAAIATAIQNLRKEDEPDLLRRRQRTKSKDTPGGVAVSGVGDLLYSFARCCQPVPPEDICGYITVGRGVTIHRRDCGNLLNLSSRHPERVIETDWGDSPDSVYPQS